MAIYSLAVPCGMFANIAVTHSEAVTSCSIATYSLYNLNSATATDTASAAETDPTALTIDVAAMGVIIAAAMNGNQALTAAWSNLQTNFVDPRGEVIATGGMYQAYGAETNRAVSCDWSASTGSEAGAAAAFA